MGPVMMVADPRKLSNTIVVIDATENALEEHRFANDRDGYRVLKAAVRGYRDRIWALEGAKGIGLSLTQRLVAEGEPVVNVPAKLAARVRAFGGGNVRKNDSADAHAVALAGLRARDLKVVTPDDVTTVLRLLTDRRQLALHVRRRSLELRRATPARAPLTRPTQEIYTHLMRERYDEGRRTMEARIEHAMQ
jgi:hypothetical protein